MMNLDMMQEELGGNNTEAITVYVYPGYFWVTADPTATGISSQIKIDRITRNINQIDPQVPPPPSPLQRIVCSALLGILPILHHHFLLCVEICKKVCKLQCYQVFEVERISFLSFEKEGGQPEKVVEIKNYLRNHLLTEGYYFCYKYDLSLSRSAHAQGFPSKQKFFWNANIGKNLQKLQDRRWFVGLIQGSLRSFKLTLNGISLQYVLITRRSWAKGGTRFNARGCDTKGNVANFCQTEQIIIAKDRCLSHVQVRGSVPVFWKQTGLNQEVVIESEVDKNQQMFRKHIEKLLRNYEKVLIVNLLCLDRKGEDELTYYYEKLIKQSNIKNLRYQFFDVHCAAKGQKFERCNYLITNRISPLISYFSYFSEDTAIQTVTSMQKGVVRVNCLDNLDRTNLIQSKIAYQVLSQMLDELGVNLRDAIGAHSVLTAADDPENKSVFVIHLKNMWADNGDLISKHYTGTGSTHTNVTRAGKRDLKGMFDHGFKSCMRLYQQYVDDNQKQEVIDILLCEHTQTVNLQEIELRLKQLQESAEQEEENQW